jgi:hypothetical protein
MNPVKSIFVAFMKLLKRTPDPVVERKDGNIKITIECSEELFKKILADDDPWWVKHG